MVAVEVTSAAVLLTGKGALVAADGRDDATPATRDGGGVAGAVGDRAADETAALARPRPEATPADGLVAGQDGRRPSPIRRAP